MSDKVKKEGKRTNPILWFLFAIIIPFIVASTIAVIVLMFVGVDVKGWVVETGEKIPIVSHFISTAKEADPKKDLAKAEEKISEKDLTIESLTKEVDNLKITIESLEQEVIKTENKLKGEMQLLEEAAEQQTDANKTLKDLAASFKAMNTKQAALIFADLDQQTAIELLYELPSEVRGGILEAMEPKTAASLMSDLLKK